MFDIIDWAIVIKWCHVTKSVTKFVYPKSCWGHLKWFWPLIVFTYRTRHRQRTSVLSLTTTNMPLYRQPDIQSVPKSIYDLDLWAMTFKSSSTRGTNSTKVYSKIDNNPSRVELDADDKRKSTTSTGTVLADWWSLTNITCTSNFQSEIGWKVL